MEHPLLQKLLKSWIKLGVMIKQDWLFLAILRLPLVLCNILKGVG